MTTPPTDAIEKLIADAIEELIGWQVNEKDIGQIAIAAANQLSVLVASLAEKDARIVELETEVEKGAPQIVDSILNSRLFQDNIVAVLKEMLRGYK